MLNLLLERTESWMGWLWTTTWQSAVLIGIILLAQRGLGRWLAPRWRHALWLLVMARLVWPCFPESRWSVFNLAGGARESKAAAPMLDGGREPARRTPGPGPGRAYDPPTGAAETKEKAPAAIEEHGAAAAPIQVPRVRALALGLGLLAVWLAGIVVFTVHLGLSLRRLRRALRERVAVVDPGVRRVLEECRERLGVRGRVGLQETGAVKSPALCGLWRPCLLLPPGLTRRFSPAELRLVFLHELAHLRRGDIALNWAATLLQIAHWFNPLVWLAFRRMRADRELACDALVLSVTPEAEHSTYGETIIKLLEAFSQAPARAALVGIIEDKNQMKRRIRMIANYRKAGGWSVCAGLLLPLLGALTFTQARTDRPMEAATPAPSRSDDASGVSHLKVLTVTIRKTEPYFHLGTEAIKTDRLPGELEDQAGKYPGLLLCIRTEKGVPYSRIATVLDMAKKAAISHLTFLESEARAEPPDAKAPAAAAIGPIQDAEAKSADQTVLIRRLKLLDHQKTIGALELSAAREALKQCRLQSGEDNPLVKQQLADIAALEAKEKAWGEEIQEISARVRDFVLHPQPGEAASHPTPPFTRRFVRLVADLGSLAFEGEPTTWPDLPDLLGQVPNRPQTVLELAAATDDMTLRQMNEAESKCRLLAAQYRFESLRVIGVQPARSKGSPAHEVTRSGSATPSGTAEADRRPRFIYVTGEVLKPGSIPMLDGTQYTVFDAIGQAGGLTKAAKKNKLKLIRQGRAQYLDLQALENIKDPNDIIYLEPGDSLDVPQSVW